jgi:hypothetical protein
MEHRARTVCLYPKPAVLRQIDGHQVLQLELAIYKPGPVFPRKAFRGNEASRDSREKFFDLFKLEKTGSGLDTICENFHPTTALTHITIRVTKPMKKAVTMRIEIQMATVHVNMKKRRRRESFVGVGAAATAASCL